MPFRPLAPALILAFIQVAATGSGAVAQQADTAKERKFIASNWMLNCQPDGDNKDVLCQASQSVAL